MSLIDFEKLKEIEFDITGLLEKYNLTNIERKFVIEQLLSIINIYDGEQNRVALEKTKVVIKFKEAQNKDK